MIDRDKKPDTATVLRRMADTYEERHKIYGDNFEKVGSVMTALFPDGLGAIAKEEHIQLELFECIIIKLCRFANSDRRHKDSLHDMGVYCAMLEMRLIQAGNGK